MRCGSYAPTRVAAAGTLPRELRGLRCGRTGDCVAGAARADWSHRRCGRLAGALAAGADVPSVCCGVAQCRGTGDRPRCRGGGRIRRRSEHAAGRARWDDAADRTAHRSSRVGSGVRRRGVMKAYRGRGKYIVSALRRGYTSSAAGRGCPRSARGAAGHPSSVIPTDAAGSGRWLAAGSSSRGASSCIWRSRSRS